MSNRRFYRAILLGAWSLAGQGAGAAEAGDAAWFTITGDGQQAQAETVQVDPAALKSDGDFRTMNVRVNRSQRRNNWDGISYRSYTARVLIYGKQYAGTWSGKDHGGHLFGRIERAK